MVPAHDAPQQYKQTSRKGKRAWRKHVDVSDVQTGLDNARQEIIQGGIIVEKSSEDLFTLDTQGSQPIQNAYNKTHKPLRSDQILAQRSAIPAVKCRKRSNVTDGVIEPSTKKNRRNGVSHKEYQRLQNIAFGNASASKDVPTTSDELYYDPWGLDSIIENQNQKFNYLTKPKPIRAPQTLKEAPISLVEGISSFPAIPKPKAGTSYNPMFEDYDKILVEEGEKEVAAERRRLREAELEQSRIDKIDQSQKESEDWQTEDESAWEGIESEYEGEEWLKKRRPERKTPTERNRVKRRKEAERLAKREAQVKKKVQQAQRIKAIAKEISEKRSAKAISSAKTAEHSSDCDDLVLRRRKLGKSSIPDAPLELVLPDELQDSLRLLKPEGNLLKDRFRSILLRGKVESRRPIQQPKKPRKSYTEKWSYKDWRLAPRIAT